MTLYMYIQGLIAFLTILQIAKAVEIPCACSLTLYILRFQIMKKIRKLQYKTCTLYYVCTCSSEHKRTSSVRPCSVLQDLVACLSRVVTCALLLTVDRTSWQGFRDQILSLVCEGVYSVCCVRV